MSGLISSAKEILFALDEIKRLRGNIGELRADIEKLDSSIRLLEERDKLRELEFTHLAERTRTFAEAGIQVGIARMETTVQGKLVELDLRLKAVETAGTPPASPRLPRS